LAKASCGDRGNWGILPFTIVGLKPHVSARKIVKGYTATGSFDALDGLQLALGPIETELINSMDETSDSNLVQPFYDEQGRIFNFIHLSRPNTKKLLVHFTAFFGEWGDRKEHRENYQGYFHRLRMLKDAEFCSVLFVCDQFGAESNGTYYTGEAGDFFVERAMTQIIEQAMKRDGVTSDGLVTIGSSAGATGAIKFGLMFDAKGILAICPHIDLDTSATLQNRMPHVSFVVPDGDPTSIENRAYTRQITNMVASKIVGRRVPRLFIQSCSDDHGVHREQVVPLASLWRSKGGQVLLDTRRNGGHTSVFATKPLILDVVRKLFGGQQIHPRTYAWRPKFRPPTEPKTIRRLIGDGLRAVGLRKPINIP
jgi:hypothetical protein